MNEHTEPACECRIECTAWDPKYYIVHCPLHKSAPDLLTALRLCLPIMEAHTKASHLTDGFSPRVNKNDHVLAQVKAAIEKAEINISEKEQS